MPSMLADEGPAEWPQWNLTVASGRVVLFTCQRGNLRWATSRQAKVHLVATTPASVPLYAVWETRMLHVPRRVAEADLGVRDGRLVARG